MGDKIVWLAAYPKTGSTWVRAILHELLASKARAVEAIQSFDKRYPADAPWYRLMGQDAKLLRTHSHVEHPGFKRIQKERSDKVIGVITVQRHPLDVLLSQLNYSFTLACGPDFKDGVPKKVEDIIRDGEIGYYIDAFIEAGGCPVYLGRCGAFADFYSGWGQFAPTAKHLHLRYEDLVKDRIAGVQTLIDFLERPAVPPSKIVASVEKRTEVDGKFYWRKQAYNFETLLDADLVGQFEKRFADELTSLGYPPGERQRSGEGAQPPGASGARAKPAKGKRDDELTHSLSAFAEALEERRLLEEALAAAVRTSDELVRQLRAQEKAHSEQLNSLRESHERILRANDEALVKARQELKESAAALRQFTESSAAAAAAAARETENLRAGLEAAERQIEDLKARERTAHRELEELRSAQRAAATERGRLQEAARVAATTIESQVDELKRLKKKYRAAQLDAQSERQAHAATREELDRLSSALPVRAFRATASILPSARARSVANATARTEALRTIRESGLFDADWYRSRYPDIELVGTDPLGHFVDHGWRENRDPSPHFSTSEYLRRHPEIAGSNVNPLLHYLQQHR